MAINQYSGESSREARQRQAVLEFLKDGHTYREIAQSFGIHYQTAWRIVKQLRDEERVVEFPFRDGKEARFVALAGQIEGGTVRIVSPGGVRTLSQWAVAFNPNGELASFSPLSDISGALSQVWRYRAFVDEPNKQHLAGSITPAQVKPQLRKCLESLKGATHAVQQMLLSPIWDSDTDIIEAYGEVNADAAATMVHLGEEFEKRLEGRMGS